MSVKRPLSVGPLEGNVARMREDIRRTGILLHPTSLPGRFGTGDIGAVARHFIDWCQAHTVTLWQVLPLVPPGPGFSPYSTPSAFAGSPWLLDLEDLRDRGFLSQEDLDEAPVFDEDNVEPERMIAFRRPCIEKAVAAALEDAQEHARVVAFMEANSWAREHARFFAIRAEHHEAGWTTWPTALKNREPQALADADKRLQKEILSLAMVQLWFDDQWKRLRSYANERGVKIIGDVPIYVDHDSVEVWANRDAFQLDGEGHPVAISGVPPDPFSATGQLWGNPLYDWDAQAKNGFRFWVERMRRCLALHDVVRIDHFRGLSAYWEVPAGADDARSGGWKPGPGRALFDALKEELGELPIIAEDLGIIDAPVEALRDGVGLPGMKVLQFAFGEDAENAYLPHHHVPWSVVYTGTHDTPTLLEFWKETSDVVRDHVRRYFGVDGHDAVWDLNRAALQSCAMWAVLPLQDLFALDADARMNRPGLSEGNWTWRVRSGAFTSDAAKRLQSLSLLYGRNGVPRAAPEPGPPGAR